MAWDNAYTAYIYIKAGEGYKEGWENQILGNVIKPVVADHEEELAWTWVTSYVIPNDPIYYQGDHAYPDDYKDNSHFYYMVVRFAAKEDEDTLFIQDLIKAYCKVNNYFFPFEWKKWNFIEDLGGNRFNHPSATQEERKQRSKLILEFMYSTIKLKLDSLVDFPEGKWREEYNSDGLQNPDGSFFQSLHHLFCNVTSVKTPIEVYANDSVLQLATTIGKSYNMISNHFIWDLAKEKDWKKIYLYF